MRTRQHVVRGITSGLLAGAAGATALNIVSYTKQSIDGTASSATVRTNASLAVSVVVRAPRHRATVLAADCPARRVRG